MSAPGAGPGRRFGERRFAVGLAAAVAVGAALRFVGLRFGLPFLFHPDEAAIVDRALRMPEAGPNPHWFQYPTLYVYAQAGVYYCLYLLERAVGSVADRAAFLALVARDPTAVYAAGRAVTATLGAATVALLGLAGRRSAAEAPSGGGAESDLAAAADGEHAGGSTVGPAAPDAAVGLAAAVLLAVYPLHVEHSHFVTTDVPLAFVATGLLWWLSRSAPSFAGAGALVGVAASLKYPGALLSVPVALVWLQRTWADRASLRADAGGLARAARPLGLAGLAAVAAFVATSPYVVLSSSEFLRDFQVEGEHMQRGHLGFEAVTNGWAAQLDSVVGAGGLGLLVLFAVGLVAVVRSRSVEGRASAATALVLFAVAGASRTLFARYLVFILPFACLVAAEGAGALAALVGRALAGRSGAGRSSIDAAGDGSARTRTVATLGALAAVVLAASALPAFVSWQQDRLLLADDTRAGAWRWTAEHAGPDGAALAAELYSVPSGLGVTPTPLVYDLGAVCRGGARYVAVTDRMYRRFLRARDRYPAQAAFYRELLLRGRLAATFTPYEGDEAALALKGGEPRARGAGEGRRAPLWRLLPSRSLAGPVILIYELPEGCGGEAPTGGPAAPPDTPDLDADEE